MHFIRDYFYYRQGILLKNVTIFQEKSLTEDTADYGKHRTYLLLVLLNSSFMHLRHEWKYHP